MADADEQSTPGLRTSELFSAIDADVTFSSSDNVLFNIHRKNLEIVSGAFPPAEFSTDKEIVPLTESSAILELLFQFAYPSRRHLLDIYKVEPFNTSFMELAEAADKYEVYPAINICQTRMRCILSHSKCDIPDHYAIILAYACKHGHMDLADMAAPLTLALPQPDVVALLTPAEFMAYVKYVAAWNAALQQVYKDFKFWLPEGHYCNTTQTILMRLCASLESLLNLNAVFAEQSNYCGFCHWARQKCRELVEERISAIPNFSEFFGTKQSA